jgi:hypothetical protein
MAVTAFPTYGGNGIPKVSRVWRRSLYIGVHARDGDVTAAWLVLWPFGHVRLHEDALRAAAATWPLPTFTRLVELTSCFMARSI